MTAQTEAVRSAWSTSHCPYQGLMAYTAERARYFFGRTRDIELIASNARAHRFCLLYGPSGVGKSSLLQAGVVHTIREETANRRTYFGADAVETVVCYLKEWRDDPMAALWASVEEGFAHEQLAVAPRAEGQDVVGAMRALCEEHDVDLVLILDQFEEFFLYHPNDVRQLARQLARLVGPDVPANVLVSIREDALSLVDEFEGIVPGVFAHTLKLELLDEPSARAATVEPLRTFNAEVPESERRDIEPELVDRLMREVRIGSVQVDSSTGTGGGPRAKAPHPGDGTVRIEAPFLQLVLTRLWDEEAARGSAVLRASTLSELGGAQKIVENHLERVMRDFTPAETALLADAFGQLVTPSGSKIAHRPSDLAELSGHTDDGAGLAALLHRLTESEQRILREVPPPMDEPHAEPRYEIFHDVLALAVLDWRRRFLTEARARQAQAETREAKRRLRRARSLLSVMALLVLVCAGLAVWAWDSRNDAESAERDATRSADVATANGVLDDVNRLLRTDPAAALALAQGFELDPEHDPASRFEAAYRTALDAADTDVELRLGSPAVLADFASDDAMVTVTEDRRVRVWHVTGTAPLRLDDEPDVDVQLPGDDSSRVTQAVVAASGEYVVVVTDTGDLASVKLASGAVQKFETDLGDGVGISTGEYGERDRVVAGDSNGDYALLDVADHRVVSSPGLRRRLDSASLDVSGDYLAVVTQQRQQVELWDLRSDRRVAGTKLVSHTDQTVQFGRVTFTDVPSGSDPVLLVLATGWRTEASLWDALNEGALKPLGGGDDAKWRQVYDWADIWHGQESEEERYSGLVAVAGDKRVRLFDSRGDDRGELYTQTADLNDWATGVQVNPHDTSIFAVASNEGYVQLYQMHSLIPLRPLWTFRGHSGTINQLRWSQDGQSLVTASRDGTVRVWRVPAARSLWYSTDWILASRFTPDGRYLFGFTPGGYVVRTDAEGGDLLNKFVSLYGQITDMDPAPDGQRAVIAEGYCGPPLKVGMAEDDEPVTLDAPTGTNGCLTRVGWNPQSDRPQVVAGTYDGKVVSWDAETGKVTATAELGPAWVPVLDVAFSGDGKTIVASTGGADGGRLHVLSADDLSEVRDDWAASDVDHVDVSADGRYIATAGNDRHVVRVWDVEDTDEPLRELRQATGTLGNVTLSQDDGATRVAVATSEGLVYVWDRESGRLLAALHGHADAANQAAFDPDDTNRVVSAGDDGEMSAIDCALCSADAGDLAGLAEDRLAQVIDLTD